MIRQIHFRHQGQADVTVVLRNPEIFAIKVRLT